MVSRGTLDAAHFISNFSFWVYMSEIMSLSCLRERIRFCTLPIEAGDYFTSLTLLISLVGEVIEFPYSLFFFALLTRTFSPLFSYSMAWTFLRRVSRSWFLFSFALSSSTYSRLISASFWAIWAKAGADDARAVRTVAKGSWIWEPPDIVSAGSLSASSSNFS